MQHDIFINPSLRTRAAFPFVAELQANIAEGRDRLVAPMARFDSVPFTPGRLSPVIRHDGQAYYLVVPHMGLLPRNRLTQSVGSVAQFRDEIIHAIDWLFSGI